MMGLDFKEIRVKKLQDDILRLGVTGEIVVYLSLRPGISEHDKA